MKILSRFGLVLPAVVLLVVACGGDDQPSRGSNEGDVGGAGGSGSGSCAALASCCQVAFKTSGSALMSCLALASSNSETQCADQVSAFHQEGLCATSAGAGGSGFLGGGGHSAGAFGAGPTGAGPTGAGPTGAGPTGAGPTGMGPTGLGGGQGAGTGGGRVYCGAASETECACGTAPAHGWSASGTCSPASVPGPSLCCASSTYPNNDPNVFSGLGCVCSKVTCIEAGTNDYCACGFSTSMTGGDHEVGSCSGALCCRSKSLLAPMCYCLSTSSVKCSDIGTDDEEVSSCGTSDVQCGGSDVVTVPTCK